MFLKKLLYPALLFFFITSTIIICLPDGAHATITAYMPYYAIYNEVNGTNTYSYIIIRRFKLNNTDIYLYHHPYTLTNRFIKTCTFYNQKTIIAIHTCHVSQLALCNALLSCTKKFKTDVQCRYNSF